MALRQYQNQPQPQNPTVPHTYPTPVKRKQIISKGEKMLLAVFVATCAILMVFIVQTHSEVRAVDVAIQQMERQIDTVNRDNTDLEIQVAELSSYERIWLKAKELGLTLNEKNVKVVSGE
ncbi:cell division protein FtsL [Chryseomicrobium sp. FSL W7-1435]|uniref:cell division protein FtsL n=1 Tax=Chryseomicrobium sp. FSL W7-1435 TaxID=2921704 RepID=UPI00315B2D31